MRVRHWSSHLVAASLLLWALSAAQGCKRASPAGDTKPGAPTTPKTLTDRQADAHPAEIAPQEARKRLDSQDGWVYLDVRTRAEFREGHVPGAWNIPVAVATDDGPGMVANSHFLTVVEATFDNSAHVIVGCRSGRRSARARKIMLQAGYSSVTNMVGGWLGGVDSTGATIAGWSRLGYPIERGAGDDKGYLALLSRSADP